MTILTEQPIWLKIEQNQRDLAALHLRNLFVEDKHRFQSFSLEAAGIFLDFSKNRINTQTVSLFSALADAMQLSSHREALFSGAILNHSEQLAASYPFLRNPSPEEAVLLMQEQIQQFVMRLTQGKMLGFSGKAITDIVHIGVGGSHLGPELLLESLKDFQQNALNIHFLSDQDSELAKQLFCTLNPETTLIFCVSKTFKTQEMIRHTDMAIRWLLKRGAEFQQIRHQLYAITANQAAALSYGIVAENIFLFPAWVGGRFSVWSAVSLSVACVLGFENYQAFLAGAHDMDEHFKTAEFSQNMPVILAMLAIWYQNAWQAQTHAIIPYCQRLQILPTYLQQLHMESLGKSVNQSGEPLPYKTGRIIWGGVGPNSQHSFHQLLMQGTHLVPVDFIVPLKMGKIPKSMDEFALANCLAQSQVLMRGANFEELLIDLQWQGMDKSAARQLAMHKQMHGNNPSNTLLLNHLNPKTLGALLALYEHKVFVQSVLWNINAFDQWGVELGKEISQQILTSFHSASVPTHWDCSTQGLIHYIQSKESV